MEALAHEWLRLDRDENTRSEIRQLLLVNDVQELESRLSKRLTFGTAGLRGRMGAGFSRLNSLTIIQTSQGLAEHVLGQHEDARKAGIVVGYDARHNSKHFAELAAAAFIAKQIKVWWYEDLVHTPLVPFGVTTLKAAAGVMVTASHNPAQDNGYKVYGPNGCQINTPIDEHIAASILKNLEPITWDVQFARTSHLLEAVRMPMTNRYLKELVDFTSDKGSENRGIPGFVYTPMHGVGLPFMQQALDAMSSSSGMDKSECPQLVVVEEQASPDPDFPTVRYPNPEEDGALDLAKATADKHDLNLIIANDPDADRLAMAEKIDGAWVQFTGDQVGVLLAHFLLARQHDHTVRVEEETSSRTYVLASSVSSHMLSRIASSANISFKETLTGFKWLGDCALGLEKAGHQCLIAYEEALGYMFPTVVHDKDGILAAAVFLRACSQWQSPWAELQTLYQRHGHHVTMNTYWRSSNLESTKLVFEGIRKLGNPYPATVAGRTVRRWRDLTIGYDSDTHNNVPDLPCSADSQMITCWLDGTSDDDGVRLTVRASGTEPKIKIYLECVSVIHSAAKKGAIHSLKAVSREWFSHPDLKIEDKYAVIK